MVDKNEWLESIRSAGLSESEQTLISNSIEDFVDTRQEEEFVMELFIPGQKPSRRYRRVSFQNTRFKLADCMAALASGGATFAVIPESIFATICGLIALARTGYSALETTATGNDALVISALHAQYANDGRSGAAVFSLNDAQNIDALKSLSQQDLVAALETLELNGWLKEWGKGKSWQLVDEIILE